MTPGLERFSGLADSLAMRIIEKAKIKVVEETQFTLRLDPELNEWLEKVCRDRKKKTGKFLSKQRLVAAILMSVKDEKLKGTVEID